MLICFQEPRSIPDAGSHFHLKSHITCRGIPESLFAYITSKDVKNTLNIIKQDIFWGSHESKDDTNIIE